jgi:hypothetical protein
VEPITLIVAALAAGAAIGLRDTASSAVQDAYAALKSLVRSRLSGRPNGQMVLEQHAADPDVWEKPLIAELTAVDAGTDLALVAAAERLISLADDAGMPAAKYRVDIRNSQGVQVGDGNVQHNVSGRGAAPGSSQE